MMRWPTLMLRHYDNPNMPKFSIGKGLSIGKGMPWLPQEYVVALWIPIYPRRWVNVSLKYIMFPKEPPGGWSITE
jgi:hypothetical protein